MESIAPKIGGVPQTLNDWVKHDDDLPCKSNGSGTPIYRSTGLTRCGNKLTARALTLPDALEQALYD